MKKALIEMDPVNSCHENWYAIRTRSRHEKVVRDQLLARGIEPLLPLCVSVRQWKDRRKILQLPLFPGYCFAKFSFVDRITVLQVPGVIDIVGTEHIPVPIPDSDIETIKTLVLNTHRYNPHPYLSEGTLVEVTRGPFFGLRGHVVRTANQCRLVLAIHAIQQAASLEIDASDVAPLPMAVS